MLTMTLSEIAGVIGARVAGNAGDNEKITINSVSTDTRSIKPGQLFFALKGERHDAHRFAADAAASGAAALVLNRMVEGIPAQTPVLLVEDTLAALQDLARYNLERCRKRYPQRGISPVVIGITGSNGKTTTKDMVYTILKNQFKTLKNEGNFNNEIGLPLTLLRLDEGYQAVVLEMGMRGPGDIDTLCRIAPPEGAVITTIGETHLELLGSVDNIARAKGEILDHISPEGFAVINAESPFAAREAERCRGRVLFFGGASTLDIWYDNLKSESRGSRFRVNTPEGDAEIYLPLPGRHNVLNALAAIGVGIGLGLDLKKIVAGLEKVRPSAMRLEIAEIKPSKKGFPCITVIDDTYNANPASTKAALEVLMNVARGRRAVAVLGSMFELGPREEAGHYEVGEAAAKLGVDCLVAVGELARKTAVGAREGGLSPEKVFWCKNNDEALKVLDEVLVDGDVILVKGSRGMKMEQVVWHFKKW